MKRFGIFFLLGIMVSVPVFAFTYDPDEALPELLVRLADDLEGKHIAQPFGSLLGNERVSVEIIDTQGAVVQYHAITESKVILSIASGSIEEATVLVQLNEETLRAVLGADDAFQVLKDAYADRDIKISGQTMLKKLKIGIVHPIAMILLWFLN